MRSFKKFLKVERLAPVLSEALSNPTLNTPASAGPNSGLQRYEIFANKVWGKGDITSHIKNDAGTVVIKKVEMGGKIYSASNPRDKAKFIKDYMETDGSGFKIIVLGILNRLP